MKIERSIGKGEKMITEPVHVNESSFENTVIKSSIPVIVDFWASWCGPCRTVLPLMDTIAKDYAGKILVAEVNVDENPELANKYGVQTIPNLFFLKGGEIKDQHIGTIPLTTLKEKADKLLA